MKKNEKLAALLLPCVEALGYELVGVEYHPNSVNSLLRVYIDKAGGIELDDCVAVNEQVSGILDVEDPISGKYTLEISSPGLDRPLFNLADFRRFIGSQAKIRLSRPIGKQRNFKAEIIAVNDHLITVQEADGKQTELDFNYIEVTRLIPSFRSK
ncbi:MAG: ribosome maturation factor RimP [Gammaproteobacteria bacterium]|nr:MAG: ribosome maturation factor RimP [Gammaproteobacteria bacterium]